MKIMGNPEFEHLEIIKQTNIPHSLYKTQFNIYFLNIHCISEMEYLILSILLQNTEAAAHLHNKFFKLCQLSLFSYSHINEQVYYKYWDVAIGSFTFLILNIL